MTLLQLQTMLFKKLDAVIIGLDRGHEGSTIDAA